MSFQEPTPLASPVLPRTWLQLGVFFIVLGGLTVAVAAQTSAGAWWVHGIWCITAFVLAAPVVIRVFRADPTAILRDHFLMLTITFCLYYAFGASLLAFGSADAIAEAVAYYPLDASDALRVDSVNSVGFGLALVMGTLTRGGWLQRQASHLSRITASIPPISVIATFLTLSLIASIRVLSVDFGFQEGPISGLWRSISQLSLVAIFLAASNKDPRRQWIWFVGFCVMLMESAIGLLLFRKSGALLPLLAFFGGLSIRYPPRLVLSIGILIMGVLFVIIGKPVMYSRNAISDDEHGVTAGVRLRLFQEGLREASGDAVEKSSASWIRLSYTVPQAAALDFFDRGRGGDDIELVPWLLVPRMLAPDKPIITRSAAEFHTKISGGEGSSTGQGLFASGYYNGGWPGVLLAGLITGWVLAQTSAAARIILAHRAFLLLPFALLGVYMGFRIDGHIVSDIIGPFIFLSYPMVLISLLTQNKT